MASAHRHHTTFYNSRVAYHTFPSDHYKAKVTSFLNILDRKAASFFLTLKRLRRQIVRLSRTNEEFHEVRVLLHDYEAKRARQYTQQRDITRQAQPLIDYLDRRFDRLHSEIQQSASHCICRPGSPPSHATTSPRTIPDGEIFNIDSP